MRAEVLERLMTPGVMPRLRALHLDWNKVRAPGAKLLAKRPESSELRTLDLRRNVILDEGAFALAASSYLGNLEVLWLDWNGIGPEGRAAIEGAPWFEGVRQVRWAHNG